ncbi:MAG: hypothetical protein PHI98_03805 [Eubacteriales bacterium]|nr:hypothetical protein [Eubacteriales bacterium]
MTWLDVGNGWRNIFLLSCGIQALALGALFTARRWFARESPAACFLTGVAATPLVQYLWMLLLSFSWPTAPKLLYIGALPALSLLLLLGMTLRRMKRLKALLHRGGLFVRRLCRFDKPSLICLCFALCVMILLLPPCVRFLSSMNSIQGGDAGEYMALAERYCNDRSIGNLLEKEETVGHFRGHSHFPSLELYMSYGLFHAPGQAYGYPNDKAAFTGIGMLIFYALAAYAALLLILCKERKAFVLLGLVLVNLVPNLYDSVAAAPRDIWRIVGILISMLVFYGIRPLGKAKAYIGKLLLSFGVCFTVMSTHVVSFVVLPFVVAAWVLWRWGEALMRRDRTALPTAFSALGIALFGAAGTVTAYLGNLWCFFKWGEMSPWRLMTTYTTAPWYSMYMDIEYKLDETTTHLSFWQAKDDILLSYATPIGFWGFWLAVTALVGVAVWLFYRRAQIKKQEQTILIEARASGMGTDPAAVRLTAPEDAPMANASRLLYGTLLTLLTLAPMTGLLDSKLYSFSGSFLKLPRYTLQWFMLAAVMICALLAAVAQGWPRFCDAVRKRKWAWLERHDGKGKLDRWVRALPLWLCALLCVLGFVKGTNQTGYTTSFYRDSRNVMESESILLDNGFRERYDLLRAVAEAVPENEKILLTRVGYQYAIQGKGYLLLSNPIVPILNMTEDEIPGELERLQVGMIATEPAFWDERYFPLTTLHAWLQTLPEEQVVETDTMRLYLLDRSLIPAARSALAKRTED